MELRAGSTSPQCTPWDTRVRPWHFLLIDISAMTSNQPSNQPTILLLPPLQLQPFFSFHSNYIHHVSGMRNVCCLTGYCYPGRRIRYQYSNEIRATETRQDDQALLKVRTEGYKQHQVSSCEKWNNMFMVSVSYFPHNPHWSASMPIDRPPFAICNRYVYGTLHYFTWWLLASDHY